MSTKENIFGVNQMDRNVEKTYSLVVPVYNEVGIIKDVIEDFYNEFISKFEGNVEFIIAEDGSTDGTKEVLAKLAQAYPLKLHSGNERKGYTRAVKESLGLAHGDVIFFSDSDGQHKVKEFLKMVKELEHYDVVIGRKTPRKDSFYRRVLSHGYNFLIRILFGINCYDIDSGFRIYKKEVLDAVLDAANTMEYLISSEIVIRAFMKGFKIKEASVEHLKRKDGDSNIFNFSNLPKIIFLQILGLLKLKVSLRKDKE